VIDGKIEESNGHGRPFALGTFSAGGAAFAAAVIDDQAIAISALVADMTIAGQAPSPTVSVRELLETWSESFPALCSAVARLRQRGIETAADALFSVGNLRPLPPVNLPRQVFCAGANYFKHVVDLICDSPPEEVPGAVKMDKQQLRAYAVDLMTKRRLHGDPYFFNKPVSTITGALDPIVLPPLAKKPDWELELGVVIGKAARRVSRAEAMNHVAGYTIVNDISDRVLLWRRDEVKQMGTDWVAGKSAPSYLPTGPLLLPAAFIGDPAALQLRLSLNGDIRQNESTSDMIFDIPRLIEYLSSMVQLWPGDLICTGSPAGNGTHYNRFLQPGDVVESTITGLGVQRNAVIAEIIN
jgi:2,4-diketo-3-deoxy-L-fuconate hydrolase